MIVPPAHQSEVSFQARLPEVGEWHLSELEMSWSLFGSLFTIQKRFPSLESVVVWPQLFPDRLRQPMIRGQSNGRNEASRMSRLRGPHGEVRELSEYSRGDSARSIAWKASARHQRLFVRRRDEPMKTQR